MLIVRLIPGAISPVTPLGYLNYLTVKFSLAGGINLIRFETADTFVTVNGIS